MHRHWHRLFIVLFIIAALVASVAVQPPQTASAKKPAPKPSPSESPTPTPQQRIQTLEQTLRDDPNDKNARAELGALLITTGNPYDGRAQLEQVLRQGMNDARVWFYVGQADSMLNDPVDAMHAFERAEILDPANSGVLAALVDAYLQMNRVDDAYRVAKRSVQLNPKDASSYDSLGTVLLDEGKVDDGRKMLAQALSMDPKDTRARILIAHSYMAQKSPDPDTAIAKFDEVLKDDPNNIDALRGKADALARKNDVAGAVALLQQVAKLQPERPDAEVAIAELYLSKKMIAEARKAFATAQQDHPTSEVPWVFEAEYDAQQNNFTQAATEYQTALNLTHNDPRLLFEYGRVQLIGLKDAAGAEVTFGKLVAAQPNDPEALFWLGQSYALERKWLQARDLYHKAFDLSHSYQALFNLGLAYFNLKDYRHAREVFEALAFNPATRQHPDPQLWFVLGETDRHMGDKRAAIFAYKHFLALAPRGDAATKARSYIRQLGG